MKFWQKIYLVTLVLFLVFLNGSIILVYQSAYKETIRIEKDKAAKEEQIIANTLSRDLYALHVRNDLNDITLKGLMDTYTDYYSDSKVYFKLWLDKSLIYGIEDDGFGDKIPEGSKNHTSMTIRTYNHQKYIYVTSVLSKPENDYAMTYMHPISDSLKMWDSMKKIFLYVSLISSVTLAFILFIITRRIAQPLEKLSGAARKIAKGDYHNRVEVKGKDEVAILAEDFNNMSVEVENKIEELTKESESKQRFIDNLAHELRTPLTSIQGFAEYMQNVEVDEELRIRYLGYIMQESGRLQNMTKELLSLSLLKNEEIIKKDMSLNKVIVDITDLLQHKMKQKNIVFVLECPEITICANENLIQILLGNLLENAIRACKDHGRIELQVTSDQKKVKIQIRDNGVGISKENLEHIFEAFYRVDKARSRKEGGAGLGLALCRQIVDIHNGQIMYESKEKKGTCVWLLIPIEDFTT